MPLEERTGIIVYVLVFKELRPEYQAKQFVTKRNQTVIEMAILTNKPIQVSRVPQGSASPPQRSPRACLRPSLAYYRSESAFMYNIFISIICGAVRL